MERIVTIVPEAGLHARPASEFIRTANKFEADLSIGRDDADEDDLVGADSMLAVTGLNVTHGESVRIIAEGTDAATALDALEAVLTTPVEDDGNGEA
jgi:phosphocarrier protein